METITPLFSARSLPDILTFYQALGFAITYQQEKPYLYAALQRGHINLHFTKGSGGATCLIHVVNVSPYHRAFADGLRAKYGKIPVSHRPRITRLKAEQTRFSVYDPAGNTLVFINHDEPEIDYEAYDDTLSPLMQVLETVKFLRDTYADDRAAAKLLDKKLPQHSSAPPVEQARALAARAELAVALGETALVQTLRATLEQMTLSDEDRRRYQDELQAAERLERWLIQAE